MKINLRKRKTGKKVSLYLDIFRDGVRHRETLGIYLFSEPKNALERKENKTNQELAENIRARRQLELLNEDLGFESKEKRKSSFSVFMHEEIEKRKKSNSSYSTWRGMARQFFFCMDRDLKFQQINRDTCLQFKKFLDQEALTIYGTPLSHNTKFLYFCTFRSLLLEATKQGYFLVSPCVSVPRFKYRDTKKEFLFIQELQKVSVTDCDHPVLKSAFLFSCLTGLRLSDINRLTWSDVQESQELGYFIHFRQKKTEGLEVLPISEQAVSFLGNRQKPEDHIFHGLKYPARNNQKLRKWMLKAGITKRITFHCARHTFATLQLANGTDLYTVSKLLGHREIKTTQVYTKVIDEKKIIAANKIKL